MERWSRGTPLGCVDTFNMLIAQPYGPKGHVPEDVPSAAALPLGLARLAVVPRHATPLDRACKPQACQPHQEACTQQAAAAAHQKSFVGLRGVTSGLLAHTHALLRRWLIVMVLCLFALSTCSLLPI